MQVLFGGYTYVRSHLQRSNLCTPIFRVTFHLIKEELLDRSVQMINPACTSNVIQAQSDQNYTLKRVKGN